MNIKTLSKHIIEGLTMVVAGRDKIPDSLNNYSVGGCTSGLYINSVYFSDFNNHKNIVLTRSAYYLSHKLCGTS